MSDFGIPNANTGMTRRPLAWEHSSSVGSDQRPGLHYQNGGQGCVISSFGDGLGVARCNCPLTESEQQFQFVNNWTKIGQPSDQVRRRHPLCHELAHSQRQQPDWRI